MIRAIVVAAILGALTGPAIAQDDPAKAKIARDLLYGYHARDPERSTRKLHVVYFTPMDRAPAIDWQPRVQRVVEHICDFFAAQMDRYGFGKRAVPLDYDKDRLIIHLVKGARPSVAYNPRTSDQFQIGSAMRDEIAPVVAAKGIKFDHDAILIFCNLMTYDGQTVRGLSPFYGTSSPQDAQWGCCFAADCPLLDPLSLGKSEPMLIDEQYGRMSLGQYNTIFIGGAAHELAHAFGLPHNCENEEERSRFTVLLGISDHSRELDMHGEGTGQLLSCCDCLRLASHPLFSGSQKGLSAPLRASFQDLKAKVEGKAFRISGRVETIPRCYAVLAYLDPAGGGDYDARTATAIPDAQGFFQIECRNLVKDRSAELRLVACCVNSATYMRRFAYRVHADGRPDIDDIRLAISLAPVIPAWKTGDLAAFRKAAAAVTQGLPKHDTVVIWTNRLEETIKQPRRPAPNKIGRPVKSVFLSN